jgi:hypothetical protein
MFSVKFLSLATLFFGWNSCFGADIPFERIAAVDPALAEGIRVVEQTNVPVLQEQPFDLSLAKTIIRLVEPVKLELERLQQSQLATERDQTLSAILQENDVMDLLVNKIDGIYGLIGQERERELGFNKEVSYCRFSNFQIEMRKVIYAPNGGLKLQLPEHDLSHIVFLLRGFRQPMSRFSEVMKGEIENQIECDGSLVRMPQYEQLGRDSEAMVMQLWANVAG